MIAKPHKTILLALVCCLQIGAAKTRAVAGEFDRRVAPILKKYCGDCHSGDDANGDVNFDAITTADQVNEAYELWDSVTDHLRYGTMPPDDSPRPDKDETSAVLAWHESFVAGIKPRPAVLRPRRLSVNEYRNTLRSVIGFDLEVDAIEAEQTVIEKSMVVKLLPTDPPGGSGFTNDTHSNPLSTVAWDQYSYLVDAALEELFGPQRTAELESLAGQRRDSTWSADNVHRLFQNVITRARRRHASNDDVDQVVARLNGKRDEQLVDAIKFELKTQLMSPTFIYRGMLARGPRGVEQVVDPYEFAERLSYFLWADMPDELLMNLARDGSILDPTVCAAQIDRMLASPKSRSLSNNLAMEWFSLGEIEAVSNNVPKMVALQSQPLDFMHYLFTNDRPLLELIDSDAAFINTHTARLYGRDAKQLSKYKKQKGIEVEVVANQKIRLEHAAERGGLLTMPGILAMNRGPILRGTWILERILGEHLPDPPANVGQVQPNRKGEQLTFRQRFEQHRASQACAVCHDKIDPLGFALQGFDSGGKYRMSADYQLDKKAKDTDKIDPNKIDTAGKLPTGETFNNIHELKEILRTSQREAVIRNVVRKTMSYALCRKLQVFDQPTVNSITDQMVQNNGTWRDLFNAISQSVAFRSAILSE